MVIRHIPIRVTCINFRVLLARVIALRIDIDDLGRRATIHDMRAIRRTFLIVLPVTLSVIVFFIAAFWAAMPLRPLIILLGRSGWGRRRICARTRFIYHRGWYGLLLDMFGWRRGFRGRSLRLLHDNRGRSRLRSRGWFRSRSRLGRNLTFRESRKTQNRR